MASDCVAGGITTVVDGGGDAIVLAGGVAICDGRMNGGGVGPVRIGGTFAISPAPFALSGSSTRLVTPPSDNTT
jgi:hypothetical protein